MENSDRKQYIVDVTGLISIGLFSLGYVVFDRLFAERHLKVPFLDFPIFVGEILLFICLILFLVKYHGHLRKLNKWHYVIIGYFIFVLVKAACGYWEWGPLALRHSALLYYPAFAVFGCAFYRREIFDWKAYSLLPLLFILIFINGRFYGYWVLTLTVLGCILIKSHPRRIIKYILFLVFFAAIPYREFFFTSRMMIVGNLLSGLYFAGTFPLISEGKKKFAFITALMIAGIVVSGMLKFANPNALKSIVDFKRMAEVFRSGDETIKANRDLFNAEERREVQLYNPDQTVRVQPERPEKDVFTEGREEIKTTRDVFTEVKEEIKTAFVQAVEKRQKFSDAQVSPEIPRDFIEKTKEKMEAVPAGQGQKKMSSPEDVRQAFVKQVQKEIEAVSVDQVQEEMSSPAEMRQAFVKQVKKGIEAVSVDQIQKEMSLDGIQAPVRQVKKRPETVYVEQPREELSLTLFEELKKETLLNFEEVIGGEAPADSVEQAENESTVYNDNAVFRIFIWRDMLVDLINAKPVFGFDFGKPLRSRSLEILHWGDGDWARDGWIAAHNSYLHIIYRTGVVGVILIVCFFAILFRMIKASVAVKSLTGVLLCGIIINWFAAANFLLIFELPYTAIPIWSLFGLTYAYFRKLKPVNR